MTGSFNEMRFFNQVPESFEDNLAHIDDLGGTSSVQPLRVGLGVGGRHAVPALEARDLPRRLDRPVRPRLAGRDGRPRRGPHAVRARDRHGADRARRARHRAAGDAARGDRRRRSRASASRTRSTTRRRRPSTSRSTSRCSATARSTTTAGARCARGRRRTSPRRRSSGAGSGHPITAGGAGGARPQRLGALPDGRRPERGAPTSPPSTRRSCAT